MAHNLIELHNEYLAILMEIEQTGGEINETHELRLEAIGREIATKADKADFVFRKLDAESDFYANEIKRLQSFKKTIDNANDKLKEHVKYVMQTMGVDRIQGDVVDLVLSKSKPRVVVEDESVLSDGYFDVVVDKKLVKQRLLEDLKLGAVEGAHLEDVYSLKVSRSRK